MHKYGNYYTPFSLRISEALMDKIKCLARQNHRSTNKEIEFILDSYISSYENKNGAIKIEESK